MADQPNFERLRQIQIAAVLAGGLVLIVALGFLGQFRSPEIAPIVICVALAGSAFGAVFYFGCLILEPSLQTYILSDDTEIKGQSVDMVTRTAPAGDARIDRWVGAYVFARNLFGLSVIPLLILTGLFLFA